MKKILLLAFLLSGLLISAQSKMNFDLARKLKEQPHSTDNINVFISGNKDVIKQLCTANGGVFRYSSGDISTVSVPVSSLGIFAANRHIQRIEAYTPRTKPLNDTMVIQTNTALVHAGAAPLAQGYDGSGVVIGIIDTGIDFTHPDFRDSLGNSRIDFLWDQSLAQDTNTPMPYNYGQEWTNIQIDSGLASAHNDLNYSGHGTHVAGIAVGNGLATGTHTGVAPKADIIVVAIDFSSNSSTLISDAVDYIYSRAAAMGKPCVINASLGDYYGSHDGQDLQAQMIRSMIDSQAGLAFVAAAGNGGNVPFHLGYTVTTDTSFTYVEPSGSSAYIQMWSDSADFSNVRFSIGADQMSPFSKRGHLPFSGINDHLGILREDTLYNNGNRIGRVLSYGDQINGTYSMEFVIYPDSASYNWRLMTTGSGTFDAWTFDLYSGMLPSASSMPDSIFYKLPDNNKTIVSSFLCLDNVIGVGNYTNRKTYIDYNNTVYVNTATNAGERHATSSIGPTRDGRIKPEICAPGDNTLAAVVLAIAPSIIANYPDALALGGFHVRNGGTSHASPCVAGIAALYLQKNPNATAMDVKKAIVNCPIRDSFTGSGLPDNYWGYGKVDAMGALTCSLTGTDENELAGSAFAVYPNPAISGTLLNISFPSLQSANTNELRIYNTLGKLVKILALQGKESSFRTELGTGLYFCSLVVNGKPGASKKLIIL
ncbi:MAG TPA: S8 family peptidase [Bacteroidia bacterium]|jgi:subtilisin family serine protease